MLIQEVVKKGLCTPPGWLPDNTHYLTLVGSTSYGVSTEASDIDYGGFCIPPKALVFAHLSGEIRGFGKQITRFGQWQEHHVIDPSAAGGKGREYDFTVYGIVKFFQLCMDNNPNMVDMLFVPADCVHHITKIGTMVRDARRLFLHKGSYHKMRGYAFSMLHKLDSKNRDVSGIQPVIDFEGEHDIQRDTSLADIELEMRRRGIENGDAYAT